MHAVHAELSVWKVLSGMLFIEEAVVATARIKIRCEELSLLQYGAFEIALRHVKLNSLSIPKEDLAIVFPVALYEVNCFWIEGVVSDGYKRHGRTLAGAILPVRRAA